MAKIALFLRLATQKLACVRVFLQRQSGTFLRTAYNNSVHFVFKSHKLKVTKTHKNSHQYHTEKAVISPTPTTLKTKPNFTISATFMPP